MYRTPWHKGAHGFDMLPYYKQFPVFQELYNIENNAQKTQQDPCEFFEGICSNYPDSIGKLFDVGGDHNIVISPSKSTVQQSVNNMLESNRDESFKFSECLCIQVNRVDNTPVDNGSKKKKHNKVKFRTNKNQQVSCH